MVPWCCRGASRGSTGTSSTGWSSTSPRSFPGSRCSTTAYRRTGRRYAIPINVFPRGDRYVFALTYGKGTDWLANVLAAGRCTLTTRGRVVALRSPRVFRDEQMTDMPAPVRVVLRRVDAQDFLEMWAYRR